MISVIVPIYNVERYINKCIDSIIHQSYKNLEIILVDDGSPDKCGEIIDEYSRIDKRIHVIHKSNGGLSSARNAGLDIASGDFIGFVDSDDWIEPTMYEEMLSFMEKEQLDLVECGINLVTNNISNKYYPGLSKGILKKEGEGVDGIYNQDISSNSVLIEVGGVYNNIDEVLNTTEALSNIFNYLINGDKNE